MFEQPSQNLLEMDIQSAVTIDVVAAGKSKGGLLESVQLKRRAAASTVPRLAAPLEQVNHV